MKPDRLGLTLIAAALAVIALILGAVLTWQGRQHSQQLHAQGATLVRALASVPVAQLAPSGEQPGMLRTLVGVQRSSDLAYALWVSPQGRTLSEVAAPDISAPEAPLPAEPAQWFGERSLNLPGDGSRILEFHAPVMAQGALAGFVRLGYRADAPLTNLSQLSFQALLALPIFLLVPLATLLLRREMKPLASLGQQMNELGERIGAQPAPGLSPGLSLEEFAQRFGQFLQFTETRMRALESERIDSVASQRVLGYRKNRVESVLHALPEAVLVFDGEGRPTFANAKLTPLLGVAPEQILGRPATEWCTQAEVLDFLQQHALGAAAAPPRAARATLALPGEAGTRHLALASYPLFAPTDPGQLFGTLVVLRDITADRLAREAGAEFVASVSHELKTPLNTLKAYSELLMDAGGGDEAMRIEAVNVIHAEVDRMGGLINNLLNISKLETGATTLQTGRVNVHDLLSTAFEVQRQSALGQGLSFRLDVPVGLGLASLDKDLLRIALNNLLSNAIKYNRPGGEVLLSAREADGDLLEIRVRDTGIGIPAEHRARIFDKYFRIGDPASAGRTGHGLGLYLARQIIELHHGSIEVLSEPGQGTEFRIRLRKLAALYDDTPTPAPAHAA